MSKKYNRSFLIFNEEDKGFEVASDKQPTGYTKIEAKNGVCKITVFAQNLRAEKGPYYCYLVDSSKSPAVVARLGELEVDKSGKGETIWEQNQDNIKGTGLSAENFNVAAVVKEGGRLQVPLAGYSGKDRASWRDKITSESFVSSSNDNGDLRDGVEDSYSSPSIKDKINQIVEKAENEVIKENREVVNSTRVNASDKNTIKNQISQIIENAENEVLKENRDLVDETRALLNLESDDDIYEDARDFSTGVEQLQRDDSDYVESYSREGYEFLHYESDINLLSEDSMFADSMTRDDEYPEVKKMWVHENDESFREEGYLDSDDDFIDDSCDGDLRIGSIEDGILARAMARANIDRHNMCHELKMDLKKLDHEIELEFKKFLERELRKYKQTMLKYICDQDKDHGCHGHHDHHHHEHKNHDCKCSHKGEHHHDHKKCDWHDYKEDHKKDFHHHGHFHDCQCPDGKDSTKSKDYAKALHHALKGYEKIEVKGAKGCKFWKIDAESKFPDKDDKMYPYYSAINHLKMTYPYINYVKYFKCKGHYFFGIKYDSDGGVKYLIYGILGDKKESHQPYKGMTGFVSWTPHQESGLWLMYYNPYTGCVMLPKGKEKDKDKRKKK